MPETRQSKRNGIEGWLKEVLGGEVDVLNIPHREVTRFRVEGLNLEAEPELYVMDRPLDEFGLKSILEDLEGHRVPKKLRDDPTAHLLYGAGSMGRAIEVMANG